MWVFGLIHIKELEKRGNINMDDKFKYEKKDSYTQDEIEAILKQKEAATVKEIATKKEQEQALAVAKAKEDAIAEFTNKNKQEQFINSFTDDKKELVQDLISSGKTIDEIQTKYKTILEATKQTNTIVPLKDILEAPQQESVLEKVEKDPENSSVEDINKASKELWSQIK